MHSIICVVLTNKTTSVGFEPPLPPATGMRLVNHLGFISKNIAIYCDLVDHNYSYTNIDCGTRGEVSKTVPSTILGIIRRFSEKNNSSTSLRTLNDSISRMTITLEPLAGNEIDFPIHVCLKITRDQPSKNCR